MKWDSLLGSACLVPFVVGPAALGVLREVPVRIAAARAARVDLEAVRQALALHHRPEHRLR